MWTKVWPIADLQQLDGTSDREVKKVDAESGGKHPLRSTELLYLEEEAVEQEYKLTQLYNNPHAPLR